MDWLDEDLILMEPINFSLVVDGTDLNTNNIFRATLQEFIGSFVYVLLFLTQTEEGITFSKEAGITCLLVASSYITSRSMVYGQIQAAPGYTTASVSTNGAISTYGAVLNPAIALGVAFAAPIHEH